METADDHVQVTFPHGRAHRIYVEDADNYYRATGFVVRQSVVESTPGLAVQVWLRNRSTRLVGFRIDRRNRLVGEAWIPKLGLTSDEFQLYVRTVAAECDHFETVLTGRDVE